MMTLEKNFSIWTSYYPDLQPEEMVLEMERRGLHVSELSDEHAQMLLMRGGDPKETGRKFKEFAAEHGISFPQGHLWLFAVICDPKLDAVEILTPWFELFGAIGIRYGVLHCDNKSFAKDTPVKDILDANVKVLKKLAPIAAENHLNLCLENLRAPLDSIEALQYLKEETGAPNIGYCLDTGHLNFTNPETQVHFIETAGDHLWALHIADNEGKEDQHMMPFGRGNVNFIEIMHALKRSGYDKLFNYEIPGERKIRKENGNFYSLMPEEIRAAKVDFVRTMTEYFFGIINQ